MKLKDKVAIVTGGTSGIGFAIAQRFVAEGAKVIITSNSEGGEQQAIAVGQNCVFVQTDVRDDSQIQSFIQSTIEKFGRIDVVVNCAGVYSLSQNNLITMPVEDFDLTMDTNLKGIFLMTKHVLPELLKTSGNIINIASIAGLNPERESAVYCASKAAVIMFSQSTALQFPEKGVRVNAICPGPIDTPMFRGAMDEKSLDMYLATNPMKRSGRPEEVANLALFLASDEAAYINGGVYTIDGGASLK